MVEVARAISTMGRREDARKSARSPVFKCDPSRLQIRQRKTRVPPAIDEVKHWLELLKAHPGNAEILNNIGAAYHRKGDLDSALIWFAKSLNANPRQLLAAKNHRVVLEELGLAEKLLTNKFMMYYFQGRHFYMPLPEAKDIDARRAELFDLSVDRYDAIDIADDKQVALMRDLSRFHADLPFLGPEKGRYRRDNHQFFETDAAILYCMLRSKQPKKVIEIGSGFSSAVMLDANDAMSDQGERVHLTFIDPDCSRLRHLITQRDRDATIIEDMLQNVDLEIFRTLNAGDILFVDSSHNLKIASDVTLILGRILPMLNDGVIIHFHDIFHNFEYPQIWVDQGFAWNEAYALKLFLMYNPRFEILFFNSYLLQKQGDLFFELFPILKQQWDEGRWIEKSWRGDKKSAQKSWMGGSLWLVKRSA
jgi:predicted O-methyltransferase YrrM